MATYAIGDIQGCFGALERLLEKIQFDVKHDVLWSTGDLVNRGPQSLAVLRFFQGLGEPHRVVLGNHDLHLLAVAAGVRAPHADDTLESILTAPDKTQLLDWLRHQPLLVTDASHRWVMTHAGLAPMWSLEQAQAIAHEVEAVLQSDDYVALLGHMYGNEPAKWSDTLTGAARWRCAINYLTRMRFCYADGRLDLAYKGNLYHKPADLIPWFDVPSRVNAACHIIFGHWAALDGQAMVENVHALDTGCVWGGCLTAMRLEDGVRFHVSCEELAANTKKL